APAEVRADHAEHEPERAAHERSGEAHQERGARAVDDAREHVTSKGIRTEQMLERRPLEEIGEVERRRVVRRDAVGESRSHDHDDDEDRARRAERTPADELAPEAHEAARSARLEVAALRRVVGIAHRRVRQVRHEYRIRGSSTTYTIQTTNMFTQQPA